jgi:NTE family protein
MRVFVLSGGANLGAVQVGMLLALAERGIVPDAVVGASVGALNATAYACDPTVEGVGRLADAWCRLRREDVFPGSRLRGVWQVARRQLHLHDPGPFRQQIESWLPVRDLADVVVPCHVATTALATGTTRWWTSGPVVDVLAASACLPCVFPPVVLDGDLHIDGAVTQSVPLERAVWLGATELYVLDAGATAQELVGPPGNALDVLFAAFRAARLARLDLDRAALPAGTSVTWLSAATEGRLRYDDFSRSPELVALGHAEAARRLATPVAA